MAAAEPRVSVVMNCYNGAAYLAAALESVRAQSYENWELVFWDNQSTDDSGRILRSFGEPRFRYYYAPHHGLLYESRNYAISRTEGSLLAFLDVDDWWSAEKLARQVELFADPEVGMACSNYWVVNERRGGSRHLKYRRPLPSGWVLSDLLEHYFVGLLTLMVRRKSLEELSHPCDARYHMIGDLDLVVRLAVHWKLSSLSDPLAFYRLHGENESLKRRQRHIEELALWVKEASAVPAISAQRGWRALQDELRYLQARAELSAGRRAAAWRIARGLRLRPFGLRFMVAACLPATLRQRLQS